MNETASLLCSCITGLLLGAIFFGGLWWTINFSLYSKYAALYFQLSMLLRTTIVLSGFHLLLGENWQKLLAGLCGFLIARLVATRLARSGESSTRSGHAP